MLIAVQRIKPNSCQTFLALRDSRRAGNATRLVTYFWAELYLAPYRSSAIPLFVSSTCLPISLLYFKAVSILMHDILNNLSPRNRSNFRELKQPRRRRQQKPHKFAYLTMKNSIFARFARAYFMFWHFANALLLSTTWNDLFRSCVDDVRIWWQMFNFVFSVPSAGSNLIPG